MKPGRHGEARRVHDRAPPRPSRGRRPPSTLSPRMPTSARAARRSRAVVDRAAADHDVEGRSPRRASDRRREDERRARGRRPRAGASHQYAGPTWRRRPARMIHAQADARRARSASRRACSRRRGCRLPQARDGVDERDQRSDERQHGEDLQEVQPGIRLRGQQVEVLEALDDERSRSPRPSPPRPGTPGASRGEAAARPGGSSSRRRVVPAHRARPPARGSPRARRRRGSRSPPGGRASRRGTPAAGRSRRTGTR